MNDHDDDSKDDDMDAAPTTLLSTVAERLYWAGRYLERAEATARLVRTHTQLFIDLPRSAGLTWSPLLAVTGSGEAFRDDHDLDEPRPEDEDEIVGFLVASRRHHGSVRSSVALARENLRVTRALVPRRSWECLNDTHHWVARTAAGATGRRSRVLWTEEVISRCHSLHGSVAATMSRDHAYGFLEIGRLVERADMTTRVLDVQAGILLGPAHDGLEPFIDLTWMAMLRSLGGEQMYRRRMSGALSPESAVEFLLCEPTFPRSVEHCLIDVGRWLLELPDHVEPMAGAVAVERLLADAPIEGLCAEALHLFVDRLQIALGDLHGCIERTYFPSQNLANA